MIFFFLEIHHNYIILMLIKFSKSFAFQIFSKIFDGDIDTRVF